jgi:hypothetical protein
LGIDCKQDDRSKKNRGESHQNRRNRLQYPGLFPEDKCEPSSSWFRCHVPPPSDCRANGRSASRCRAGTLQRVTCVSWRCAARSPRSASSLCHVRRV